METDKRRTLRKEKLEAEIENLMNALAELKADISALRKQGKDPIIPDFMLRNVKSKIMYYKVSRDKEDLANIKKIFENVRKEIKEVENREEVDIKKEVYEKAGLKIVKAEE